MCDVGAFLPGSDPGETGDPLTKAIVSPLSDLLDGGSDGTPESRDALREALAALNNLRIIAPKQFEIINDMLPRYAGLEGDISATLNTRTRGADVTDLQTLGPQAVAAIKAANPEQAALMAELNRQASEDLSLGSSLDPSLRREVAQSVREAQSARGLGYGVGDAAAEALTLGQAGEALRGRRRNFASGIAQLNQASNVDPALAVLGRPSVAFNAANARVGDLYNPQNSYVQDVNNSNFNAAWSNLFSTRNYNAAITSALIGAVGNLGGAGIGAAFCWLAREVFGWNDPRWILFRGWILQRPVLAAVYWLIARPAARLCARWPLLRVMLRRVMEKALESGKVRKRESGR